MKKTVIRKVLFAVLIISALSLVACAYEVSGNFRYKVVNDCAVITLYTANEENVIVPEEIDGYPVIGLGINEPVVSGIVEVFPQKDLKSVTLPESITFIGNECFSECKNLSSITIPNNVTYIGDKAFQLCTSLKSITIPENVTYVGNDSFKRCYSLTTVNFLGSCSIGDFVFYCCDNLKTVNIGEKVDEIGMHSFRFCTSLTSITIPKNVKAIDWEAFGFCDNLETVILCGQNTKIREPDLGDDNTLHAFWHTDKLSNIYAFKGTDAQYYAIENEIDFTPLANVVLNGQKLKFDMPPIIDGDRVLVPLRTIFEALGAEVGWDDATKTVTATKQNLNLAMQVGSTQITLNEKPISLDVPSQIVNERTLVPVRAVSEAFNAQVGWDDATSTVSITTK